MLSFTQRHRLNFKLLATGSLVLVMCAVFASPSALAACNKKGRGKDCAQPSPTPPGFTEAYLYSSNFDSGEDPLLCSAAAGTNTTNSGNYFCALPVEEVFLSTRMLTGNFAQKNWDLCHALDPTDGRAGVLLMPDEVSYGWTDACAEGLCGTEFRMFFSGDDVDAETNGKADQMKVTLSGSILTDEGTEDPFRVGKKIMLFDRVLLEFFRSSNDRAVGSCMWYTDTLNFYEDRAQAKGISFPAN